MTRYKGLTAMITMAMVLLLMGCPMPGMKPISKMSVKEKSVWMLSIYNAQYESYQTQAARLDLSEDEKQILRDKKKILTEVYGPIGLYTGYAESGVLPDQAVEDLIINGLNKLLSM